MSARDSYNPDDHPLPVVKPTEIDPFPDDDTVPGVDEMDVEAMRYEQSL